MKNIDSILRSSEALKGQQKRSSVFLWMEISMLTLCVIKNGISFWDVSVFFVCLAISCMDLLASFYYLKKTSNPAGFRKVHFLKWLNIWTCFLSVFWTALSVADRKNMWIYSDFEILYGVLFLISIFFSWIHFSKKDQQQTIFQRIQRIYAGEKIVFSELTSAQRAICTMILFCGSVIPLIASKFVGRLDAFGYTIFCFSLFIIPYFLFLLLAINKQLLIFQKMECHQDKLSA